MQLTLVVMPPMVDPETKVFDALELTIDQICQKMKKFEAVLEVGSISVDLGIRGIFVIIGERQWPLKSLNVRRCNRAVESTTDVSVDGRIAFMRLMITGHYPCGYCEDQCSIMAPTHVPGYSIHDGACFRSVVIKGLMGDLITLKDVCMNDVALQVIANIGGNPVNLTCHIDKWRAIVISIIYDTYRLSQTAPASSSILGGPFTIPMLGRQMTPEYHSHWLLINALNNIETMHYSCESHWIITTTLRLCNYED